MNEFEILNCQKLTGLFVINTTKYSTIIQQWKQMLCTNTKLRRIDMNKNADQQKSPYEWGIWSIYLAHIALSKLPGNWKYNHTIIMVLNFAIR